jgi:hypothetical protein
MTNDSGERVYVTLKNTPDLLATYSRGSLLELTKLTRRLLTQLHGRGPADHFVPEGSTFSNLISHIEAVSAPSLDWRAAFVAHRADAKQAEIVVPRTIEPDELIIAYHVGDKYEAQLFLQLVNSPPDKRPDTQDTAVQEASEDTRANPFLRGGCDPGGSAADHWCPGSADLAIFGHRAQARRAVRADALEENRLRGQSVNVVIIDEGLNKASIPPKNWGGGLDHYIETDLAQPAGSAPPSSHGMMIARSVLNLAPAVRLYDVPVIPPSNPAVIPVFISSVHAAYESLLHEILRRRPLAAQWNVPWVLVNAWGIYDTSSDRDGSYTKNTALGGHPMIRIVTQAVEKYHLDVIFAAGNCGQFCPDRLCGKRDRGPGHSIWGANAHRLVITVGAVRSDATWIGYSSQGPAPKGDDLDHEKPDLCAPSQFCETNDAARLSSGSSASCAIVAGIVAALRSNLKWGQFRGQGFSTGTVTPMELKKVLTDSARKPCGPSKWDRRLGWGILDAARAIEALNPAGKVRE